ncbi:MAG: glycogen synthase [Chloroflexi bacterium]|nr:glycogen synthase [Chloroflexota bacterium]
MKILYAAAEVDPLAKVGGLADVASALPARLLEMGHDVRVVMPCHATAMEAFEAATARRRLTVPFLGEDLVVEVATVSGEGGVPVDLVRDGRYFGAGEVYGEPDDLLRYQFFCRAVVQMLAEGPWTPDILHLNDWHTAPLAFALRGLAWGQPRLRGIASVFTIHNLRYRGPDDFNDYLCQAIYYADRITTVSPTYAQEVLTRDFGEGLDGLLRLRAGALSGIINGLNFDVYNPRTDPNITRTFDLSSLESRPANTAALRTELGLDAVAGPLAAIVARLTEQKGVDLVIQALPEMLATGAQLVVLGHGDEALESDLNALSAAHPGTVVAVQRFDEGLARRIYAGADMLLMPSRYEPCGLGQLIAMRYGCIPVGRKTGGLADTILDPDEHGEHATGFLFDEFSSFAFAGAFERAVRAFRNPAAWTHLQEEAMSRDHSWRASATRYVEVYTAALHARGIIPLE